LKALGRLLLVGGAVAVGLFLFRAAPRELTLVYGLPEGLAPTAIEVDIRRGGDLVRHAELRFPAGAPRQVRHPVRLPDGDYTLTLRLFAPGRPAIAAERPIAVTEAGTLVLPIEARQRAH
jgi:hypothetical protein